MAAIQRQLTGGGTTVLLNDDYLKPYAFSLLRFALAGRPNEGGKGMSDAAGHMDRPGAGPLAINEFVNGITIVVLRHSLRREISVRIRPQESFTTAHEDLPHLPKDLPG